MLDAYIFRTLHEVREVMEAWMTDYNECRPHESLDNMTQMEYREKKKIGYPKKGKLTIKNYCSFAY